MRGELDDPCPFRDAVRVQPENITSDSGRGRHADGNVWMEAAFGEQTNLLTIGEFDPGSG